MTPKSFLKYEKKKHKVLNVIIKSCSKCYFTMKFHFLKIWKIHHKMLKLTKFIELTKK